MQLIHTGYVAKLHAYGGTVVLVYVMINAVTLYFEEKLS